MPLIEIILVDDNNTERSRVFGDFTTISVECNKLIGIIDDDMIFLATRDPGTGKWIDDEGEAWDSFIAGTVDTDPDEDRFWYICYVEGSIFKGTLFKGYHPLDYARESGFVLVSWHEVLREEFERALAQD